MENTNIQIFLQLLLAAFLGSLLGLEREYKGKEAGLRTHALVCLAAAFFTIASLRVGDLYLDRGGVSFDPTRVMGQIILGMGFLGAGLIIYRQTHLEGLTTAAGLWLVSAIGIAVGAGMYMVSIFVTFLGVMILAGLKIIEERVLRKKGEEGK